MYCFTDYLVTYDVADNVRSLKILRVIRGYCYQVQRSVFEGKLTKAQFVRLRKELSEIVCVDDSILIYPLSYLNILNKVKLGGIRYKQSPIF